MKVFRAIKTALWGKTSIAKPENLEFNVQNPHGIKQKTESQTSCPLTVKHVLSTNTHIDPHT